MDGTSSGFKAVDERTYARRLLARRREQERVLGERWSMGSVWDLLLHIFSAESSSELTVQAIAKATGIAPTTVLRWLAELESEGLVIRARDSSDARRVNLGLSDATTSSLRALLRTWTAQDRDGTGSC
jgi:DNA-binding MarR family transcriptional regulator